MLSDVKVPSDNVGLNERKPHKVSSVHHYLATHEMTPLYSILLVFSIFHYYLLPHRAFTALSFIYICTEVLLIAEPSEQTGVWVVAICL